MKILAFVLCLFSLNASAEVLSSYSLSAPDAAALRDISRLFEITRRHGQEYEVIVPQDQAPLLRLLAPRATLLEADMGAALRARLASYKEGVGSFAPRGYHDLAQVQAWLEGVEKAHPAIASVINYGASQRSRPLLALRLSGAAPGAKPALMITAATHGDEVITTEVLMALIDQILAGYGKDPRFTRMVDEHELFFIPVVNVDGFVNVERYDSGRDPNRSYPWPGNLTQKPTASIQGLVNFFHAHNITGSLDFHAYGEMVMYPWAYTYDPIEAGDARRLGEITARMAENNRYAHGPISEVIYVAPGSSADYYYWKQKTLAVAVEMGNSKAPNPSQFPAYVNDQAESLWRFIESF